MYANRHNLNLADGRITITTQTMNDKLAGAKFALWGMPFFLNLVPEPIQLNLGKGHLIGHGMKHWFSTRDRKGRIVNVAFDDLHVPPTLTHDKKSICVTPKKNGNQS